MFSAAGTGRVHYTAHNLRPPRLTPTTPEKATTFVHLCRWSTVSARITVFHETKAQQFDPELLLLDVSSGTLWFPPSWESTTNNGQEELCMLCTALSPPIVLILRHQQDNCVWRISQGDDVRWRGKSMEWTVNAGNEKECSVCRTEMFSQWWGVCVWRGGWSFITR